MALLDTIFGIISQSKKGRGDAARLAAEKEELRQFNETVRGGSEVVEQFDDKINRFLDFQESPFKTEQLPPAEESAFASLVQGLDPGIDLAGPPIPEISGATAELASRTAGQPEVFRSLNTALEARGAHLERMRDRQFIDNNAELFALELDPTGKNITARDMRGLRPEDIQLINQTRSALPNGQIQKIISPDDDFQTVYAYLDPLREQANIIRHPDGRAVLSEPASGGIEITTAEDGTQVIRIGGRASRGKGVTDVRAESVARAEGTSEVNERRVLETMNVDFNTMIDALQGIHDLRKGGADAFGAVGAFAGQIHSFAEDAAKVSGIEGFDNLSGLFDEIAGTDDPDIQGLLADRGESQTTQLELAVLRSNIQSPDRAIRVEEVKLAIKANAPIFGPSNTASRAASSSLIKTMMNRYNQRLFGFRRANPNAKNMPPEIHPGDIEVFLEELEQRLESAPVKPVGEVLEGTGFTMKELLEERRRRGLGSPQLEGVLDGR